MDIDIFFGLDFRIKKFDINLLLDLLSIRRKIEDIDTVKNICSRFGKQSPFLLVSKRQQTLKYLQDLLTLEFESYDPLYYQKEITTSSDRDRRYNAEERLLEFSLMVASGRTMQQIVSEEFKPGMQILRNMGGLERYDRLWDTLLDVEKDTIAQFKKELAKK